MHEFLDLQSQDISIKSTSLDSLQQVLKKYPEFKDYNFSNLVEIEHQVDALQLSKYEKYCGYDAYIWNHPHTGTEDFLLHSDLIYRFFQEIKSIKGEKIILTLVKGQFERWNVLHSANENGFFLRKMDLIDPKNFIGWKAVRNTSGKCFKNNATDKRSFTAVSIRFVFSSEIKENIRETIDIPLSITQEFTCKECDKSFNSSRGLKQHTHMVHVLKKFGDYKRIKNLECNQCDKKFRSKEDLETHCKGIHLNICLDSVVISQHLKDGEAKIKRFTPALQVSSLLKRDISTELKTSLDKAVKDNKILVFIKGTKTEPQCGFSRAVIQILELNGVKEYSFVNVLENEETRQGIKEYTNWPTIPQVFVNGEFIGGCDILINMHQSGELEKLLNKN